MTARKKPAATVTPIRMASADRNIRHVFVRNYETRAKIGAHSHERSGAQKIRINIDLAVDEPEDTLRDRLEDVVCYQEVVAKIERILERGHINLVETLAEKIAEACLEDSRIVTVRVRLEKLGAIPGAESAGVEIERNR